MSYRDLEIWQEARTLTVDIHRMTIETLPKFEKINRFLSAVEEGHMSVHEQREMYDSDAANSEN